MTRPLERAPDHSAAKPGMKFGVSVPGNVMFASSASGTAVIFHNLLLPDGTKVRIINREIFYGALRESAR
jgi:hypothetical protein